MRASVLALVFPLLALAGSEARAQWMFDAPETWGRPAAKAPGQPVITAPSLGGGSPSPYDYSTGYSTAAPQPSSEWDQSGVIGRRDRDAAWHHDERMQWADSYLQGLRDGARALRPIWGPYPPPPGPLPPVVGAPRGKPPRAKAGKP